MKQIKFFFSILILFFIFSCVSSADTKYQISTKLRDKAIKYNLKKYVENEFNDAEKDYTEAKNYMDNKKSFKADRLLDQVNKKFQIVLDKGFPLCADDKNKETIDKIKIADDIKAKVAVKDLYADAEKNYNDAVKFKNTKDYENAIDNYQTAQDKFDNVYKTAKEKKDKADKSINATEQAFKEIESNSLEVQKRMNEINKKN